MSSETQITRRAVLGRAGRFALAAPFLSVLGCNEAPVSKTRLGFSGVSMGTRYRVAIADDGRPIRIGGVQAGVERVLERVNAQMSTYRRDSELSRFNAANQTEWVEVSLDVAAVIAKALDIGRRTDGAFDVTVGPLVDLWGFGPNARSIWATSDKRIRKMVGVIGHHQMEAKPGLGLIRKRRSDLRVDLSGIGKGFAVDAVADYLKAQGAGDFLVDIGGDMRLGRSTPDRATWRIGIERPWIGNRAVHRVIAVGEGAVATSGDYRNFFQSQGRVYSHIIDPHTGSPVDQKLASVTVVAASAEEADAWSTALMVLGAEKGSELAERERLAAFFIVRSEEGLNDRPSSEFARYLAT